jgi:AcrR family transcriptional regulator
MDDQELMAAPGERPSGRPRSAEAHRAILDSTLALLAELGFERMSIEAIAAHAGVGKTTIYRRWKTKEDLVADALSSVKAAPAAPDTGDLRADVAAIAESFAAGVRDPLGRRVITLIIDTLTNNPALAELYWERFGALKNDSLRAVLSRAQARGQIRRDADLDVVLDLLSGYVLYQLLVKPPSQAFQAGMGRVLDVLFQGVAAAALPPADDRDNHGDRAM